MPARGRFLSTTAARTTTTQSTFSRGLEPPRRRLRKKSRYRKSDALLAPHLSRCIFSFLAHANGCSSFSSKLGAVKIPREGVCLMNFKNILVLLFVATLLSFQSLGAQTAGTGALSGT